MKALWLPLALAIAGLGVWAGLGWARSHLPVRAAAPPVPGRVTLGVHTLVGHEEDRSPAVARTRPLAVAARGSSLLAFVAGYARNAEPPRDDQGNAWQPLGEPVVYAGYEGRFDVQAWQVGEARADAPLRVEVAKRDRPEGELTLPVIEVRDAVLADVARHYAATGTTLRSATVRTRGPALLVALWWGDGRGLRHRAVPGDGFRVVERFTDLPPFSAVQCVVAVREVDAAGEYAVSWDTAPAQGAALWLLAYEARDRAPG